MILINNIANLIIINVMIMNIKKITRYNQYKITLGSQHNL
jgi:hypothetical protein